VAPRSRVDVEMARDAAARLAGSIRETPLRPSAPLSRLSGHDVLLKLENRQVTGSFKVRGALNAVALLDDEARRPGIVAASAGNHGAGVAHAARVHGIRATIFVPAGAPDSKRERISATGAELRLVEGGYDAAHAAALEFAAATGAREIHAFSDPHVVAGQATVGLEILRAWSGPGTILVPVGGGGLIGGIGLVARSVATGVRVVGVQTPATSAMHDSLVRGALVAAPTGPTLCDGLEGDIDETSLALAREVVNEMVLVEEAAVRDAVEWLRTAEGETVEPSGAVAIALLRQMPGRFAGPVVAVVSGGNQ
jgi:threonine dehydratase